MKLTKLFRTLSPVALALAMLVGGPAVQGSSAHGADQKSTDSKTTSSKPAALVDINTATEAELVEVSGIGPSYAKKIIANRPYATVDELSKSGIPANRIAKFLPMVTVKSKSAVATKTKPGTGKAEEKTADATKPALVDINMATEAQLEEVKGIGPSYAKKIIASRPYASVKELSKTGISARSLTKIEPLVTVSTQTVAADKPAEKSTESKSTMPSKTGDTTAKTASGEKTSDKTADSTTKTTKSPRTPTEAKTPPQKGMVWVNKETKVYHVEGDHWYGRTKTGDWMTEEDAKKAGYRPVKSKQKDAEPAAKTN